MEINTITLSSKNFLLALFSCGAKAGEPYKTSLDSAIALTGGDRSKCEDVVHELFLSGGFSMQFAGCRVFGRTVSAYRISDEVFEITLGITPEAVEKMQVV